MSFSQFHLVVLFATLSVDDVVIFANGMQEGPNTKGSIVRRMPKAGEVSNHEGAFSPQEEQSSGALNVGLDSSQSDPDPDHSMIAFFRGASTHGSIVGQSNSGASEETGFHADHQFLDPKIVTGLRCVHCIMTAADWDYMISEGTLLGAARNGFLLPWDADGDFVYDMRGGDFEGFYKLFTPGSLSTSSTKCPAECRSMQVNLFVGDLKIDGVLMSPWQGYEDILSGNLYEHATSHKWQATPDVHKFLLELLKAPNPARLFHNSSWSIRDGGSYLDLVPYTMMQSNHFDFASFGWEKQVEMFEAPVKIFDMSSVMPINKHCLVRNFGKDGVETLELACPSRPEKYLQSCFGDGWIQAPYNKFNGKEWVYDDHGGTLEEFLRQYHNYTGPLERVGKI